MPALQHMRSIAELYVADSRNFNFAGHAKPRHDVLQALDRKTGLRSLVVDSLVQYMELARKVRNSLNRKGSSWLAFNTTFLSFLYFLGCFFFFPIATLLHVTGGC